MEVEILRDNLSHIIKKSDVWIAYTKDNKCFVCDKGGIAFQEQTIKLALHERRRRAK